MSVKDFLTKITLRISVVLLPLSVGFIAVAVTLLMLMNLELPRFTVAIVGLTSGALLWHAGSTMRKRVQFIFTATFLFMTGILFLFIDLGVCPFGFPAVWPLLMLFIGLSFIVSGFVRYHRLSAIFMVPALAFAALGFLFMLFSTHVIPVSFTTVVLWWVPLLLLPGFITFVIWFVRRRGANGEV